MTQRAPEGSNELSRENSAVVAYLGSGSGPYLAARGAAVDALAQGWQVSLIEFLVSHEWNTPAEQFYRRLGAEWWAWGPELVGNSDGLPIEQAVAERAWGKAKRILESGSKDLVVLDQLEESIVNGWLDAAEVVEAVSRRAAGVNAVLTGSGVSRVLIDLADSVTDMRMIKPVDTRRRARR